MELSTALARKRVGESFSFELTEKIEPQSFSGRRVEFEAPLHVVGRYVFDGKAFDLEAEVDTVLRSDCARCLKPFSEPFAFSVLFMAPMTLALVRYPSLPRLPLLALTTVSSSMALA